MPVSAEKRKQIVLASLDRFERPLLRYAIRLLNGDDASARDTVQHAFMKLCMAVELPDEVAPWLYTVCRNRAMDRIRQTKREPTSGDQISELIPTRELGPAERFERTSQLRLIQELISQLSPSEREVAELWSQGFSNQEMSQIIGIAENAVRVRLHRGLKSLRQNRELAGWIQDEKSGDLSSPISEPTNPIGQS